MVTKKPNLTHSFLFSFAERYITIFVQGLSLLVLARLIEPQFYGLFAAGQAVLLLVVLPIQLGLHDGLVTRPRLTRRETGAGTAAALLVGLLGAAVLAGMAVLSLNLPGAAGPEAATVYACLAPIPLLEAISVAGRATLARNMRFGILMRAAAAKAVIGAIVAISLAALGWDAASLAIGLLAESATMMTIILIMLPRSLRPDFARAFAPLRWASPWTAVTFFKQAGDSLAYLVIGATLGATALGLFNRAKVVIDLFDRLLTEAAGPVLLPYLSRENRSGRPLNYAYDLKLRVMSALAWPFFGIAAMMPEHVVAVVLGDAWEGAVPLVRILAIGGLFLPLSGLLFKFAQALDMVGALVLRHFTVQVLKLTLAAGATVIGLGWVALAFVLADLLRVSLLLPPLMRRLGERPADVLRALAPSALVAVGALLGPAFLAFSPWTSSLASLPLLLLAIVLAVVPWAALLLATRHPLALFVLELWARRRA